MKINNNDLSLEVDGHEEVKEIANLFANHFGYQPTSNPLPSQAANSSLIVINDNEIENSINSENSLNQVGRYTVINKEYAAFYLNV